MEERLKALLYNAICYMLEDKCDQDDWAIADVIDEIADYLGSTPEELEELGVLDLEALMEEYA